MTGLFGILGIHHYQIRCIIGVLPEERKDEQTLCIDVKIRINLDSCISSGIVQDTVDYRMISALCLKLAHEKKYFLLETFASDITKQCIEQFHAVWAWVRIKKPSAISGADYAYVEFEQTLKEV